MYRVPGAANAFDAVGIHPYAAQPTEGLPLPVIEIGSTTR